MVVIPGTLLAPANCNKVVLDYAYIDIDGVRKIDYELIISSPTAGASGKEIVLRLNKAGRVTLTFETVANVDPNLMSNTADQFKEIAKAILANQPKELE